MGCAPSFGIKLNRKPTARTSKPGGFLFEALGKRYQSNGNNKDFGLNK